MTVQVLTGHIVDVLGSLAAGSVHVAVTSPPYFALRDYGLPPQTWADGWVGDLGREDTVEAYLDHLVEVFRAVRRVLRADGTLWCNLSGNFWNDAGGQNGGAQGKNDGGTTGLERPGDKIAAQGRISAKAMEANRAAGRQDRTGRVPRDYWLKPLDFVDVPGLFAHALVKDGWLWRADMALIKRSPMPESINGTRYERCRVKVAEGKIARRGDPGDGGGWPAHTGTIWEGASAIAQWQDCPGCPRCEPHEGLVLRRGNGRPTRSWERLLVFAPKSGYFWDAEAVRERTGREMSWEEYAARTGPGRGGWGGEPVNGVLTKHGGSAKHDGGQSHPSGRNLRDWRFWPSQEAQLSEQHYASFPPGLPTLAIQAGTSQAGVCGAMVKKLRLRPDLTEQERAMVYARLGSKALA